MTLKTLTDFWPSLLPNCGISQSLSSSISLSHIHWEFYVSHMLCLATLYKVDLPPTPRSLLFYNVLHFEILSLTLFTFFFFVSVELGTLSAWSLFYAPCLVLSLAWNQYSQTIDRMQKWLKLLVFSLSQTRKRITLTYCFLNLILIGMWDIL